MEQCSANAEAVPAHTETGRRTAPGAARAAAPSSKREGVRRAVGHSRDSVTVLKARCCCQHAGNQGTRSSVSSRL